MQQLRGAHIACSHPGNPGEFMYLREDVDSIFRIDREPNDYIIVSQHVSYPSFYEPPSKTRTSAKLKGLTLAEKPTEAKLPYGLLHALQTRNLQSTPGVSFGVEVCTSVGASPIRTSPKIENPMNDWYRPISGGDHMVLCQLGQATYLDPRNPVPRPNIPFPTPVEISDFNVQCRLNKYLTVGAFGVKESPSPSNANAHLSDSLPHPVPHFEIGIPPVVPGRNAYGGTVRVEGQRWNCTLKSLFDLSQVGMSTTGSIADGRIHAGMEFLLPPSDPINGLSLAAGARTTWRGLVEMANRVFQLARSLVGADSQTTGIAPAVTQANDPHEVGISGTVNTNGTVSAAFSVPVTNRFRTAAQFDYSLVSRETVLQLGVQLQRVTTWDILSAVLPASWASWLPNAEHAVTVKYTPDRGSAVKFLCKSISSSSQDPAEEQSKSWIDSIPWRLELGVNWPSVPDVKFASAIPPVATITENPVRAPAVAAAPTGSTASPESWFGRWYNPFTSLRSVYSPRISIGISFGDSE